MFGPAFAFIGPTIPLIVAALVLRATLGRARRSGQRANPDTHVGCLVALLPIPVVFAAIQIYGVAGHAHKLVSGADAACRQPCWNALDDQRFVAFATVGALTVVIVVLAWVVSLLSRELQRGERPEHPDADRGRASS